MHNRERREVYRFALTGDRWALIDLPWPLDHRDIALLDKVIEVVKFGAEQTGAAPSGCPRSRRESATMDDHKHKLVHECRACPMFNTSDTHESCRHPDADHARIIDYDEMDTIPVWCPLRRGSLTVTVDATAEPRKPPGGEEPK